MNFRIKIANMNIFKCFEQILKNAIIFYKSESFLKKENKLEKSKLGSEIKLDM